MNKPLNTVYPADGNDYPMIEPGSGGGTKSPKKNNSIFLLVPLLLFIILGNCKYHAKSSYPNVILILCDTLRTNHLSCYGYHRKTSPFIDSLGGKGLFFETCYSTASRTGPSISSLFTSLYPGFHGAVNSIDGWDMKAFLRKENRTMAEILRDNGFHTHAVFSNVNASPRFGYHQGFDNYSFTNNPSARQVRLQALEALRTLKKKKPFFLYLHFMDPHSPYWPPEPFNNHFDPQYKGKVTGASHKQLDRIMVGKEKASAMDLEHLMAQYDSEILYFDSELRALFADLKSSRLLEDSVMIFTADHGEEFFDHGKLLHGYTLYQEQLRVPLIILGKDMPTRRISTPVSQLDLLPTLLKWLSIKEEGQFQGRDITPLLEGRKMVSTPLFAEASLKAVFTIRLKSVIKDGWKYIYDLLDKTEELYNLKEDPREKINLAGKNPDQLVKLRQQMRRFMNSMKMGAKGKKKFVPLDKKTRNQLKSLGYIQ